MKSLLRVLGLFSTIAAAIPASPPEPAKASDVPPGKSASTTSSESTDDMQTIHATLSPLNSTSCILTLTNPASTSLDFLTWNSLFDPHAEFHSFTITDPSTGKNLTAGLGQVRKIYAPKVLPSHILTIPANSNWTGTYHLTTLFNVPTDSKYIVNFATTLTVLTKTPTLQSSHPVRVLSNALTMSLSASPSGPSKTDKRDTITGCDAGQTWVMRTAVKAAAAMASQAWYWTPTVPPNPGAADWYAEYFNDSSYQTVREVLGAVANYNIDAKWGLSWSCGGTAGDCADPGCYGFAPAPQTKPGGVTLCDLFYTSTWASTECGWPGMTNPSIGSVEDWQMPSDQPSVVMHELLHDSSLTGLQIDDGPGYPYAQGQYSYDQVRTLAENVATNMDGPLHNAQNFVDYAMEIRYVKNPTGQCSGCHLIPPADVCQSAPGSEACVPC